MTVTVHGTYLTADDQSPATGRVSFTPHIIAVHDQSDPAHVVVQHAVTAPLDATGTFTCQLIASDDPGWRTDADMPYLVCVQVDGYQTEYSVLIYGPGPVDLNDLLPLAESPSVGVVPVPGPRGPQGEVSVGATVTLPAGSPATVVDVNPDPGVAVLEFGIPQGVKGDKGDRGDQGVQGEVSVGATVTGAPGSSAAVTDSDPSPNRAVLQFTIPRGDVGPQGPPGTPTSVLGNLLTANQASVETDTTGFVVSGVTLLASTSAPIEGVKSLDITFTGSGAAGVYVGSNTGAYAPVVVGQTYTLRASVIGTSGETYALVANWYNSSGSTAGIASPSVFSQTFTANGALQEVAFTLVAPANASRMVMYLRRATGAAGSLWKADRFGFWAGAGGDWAMPGTPITNLGYQVTHPNTDDVLVQAWDAGKARWQRTAYHSSVRNLTVTTAGILVRVNDTVTWTGTGTPPVGFRDSWATGAKTYMTIDALPATLPGTLNTPAPAL